MKIVRKSFLGLTFLMFGCNALSMDTVAKWARIAGDCLLGNAPVSALSKQPKTPTDPFPFTSLLPELQTLIITLISNGVNAKSLKEAAQSISSLAQVNEQLNRMINDRGFTMQLIKKLSQRFNCAHFDVCKELQTKQAKVQCDVQKQLFDLCKQASPNMNLFAVLANQGADLEFTYSYNGHIATPLMVACLANNSELVRHLLQAGANINYATPSSGMTALMVTAKTDYQFVMNQLLNSPYSNRIIIDKQDFQGNTALIYAIESKNIKYVKALLAKGTNPTLSNAKGITPLAAAQKTGDAQLDEILYEAVNSYKK